jgi:hypothetical protein
MKPVEGGSTLLAVLLPLLATDSLVKSKHKRTTTQELVLGHGTETASHITPFLLSTNLGVISPQQHGASTAFIIPITNTKT